jgi:hypothetical protein
MSTPTRMDPTFYRSAAEAIAAPTERLAYVVAFDRAGSRPDALTVVDTDAGSPPTDRSSAGPSCPRSATSCTTSGGTPAPAR